MQIEMKLLHQPEATNPGGWKLNFMTLPREDFDPDLHLFSGGKFSQVVKVSQISWILFA